VKIRFLLVAILVLILTACQSPALSAFEPTAVIVQNQGCSGADCAATAVPTLAPTLAPLRFVLPTPGAEPVSNWRPPLYPAPWAPSAHDHFYFVRPIAADEVNWPLASYRYGGVFFAPDIVHTGVDIDANAGTPILAAAPGTVIWAGWGLFSGDPRNTADPYGQAVVLRHDFGYQGQQLFTVYAHMSHVDVKPGQWVDTGGQLGLVGDTGATTGPHLHFEVRVGTSTFFTTYNPELWLVPPQGWGVLVARVMDNLGAPIRRYEITVRNTDIKRTWYINTYGGGPAHPDPYYNENMVLSDLPAGNYTVTIPFDKHIYTLDLQIFPGQVSYFTFRGKHGYNTELPPEPGLKDYTPAP
jgi:murein DD-endopeptidase MepM/ murein hydrolase activator NlpD